MSKKKPSGVVYSTNPDYNYNYESDNEKDTLPSREQNLRIWLEKNHRGGKQVTVIKGFIGKEEDMKELARVLKASCGTGGSVKEEEILIQGDFRDKILSCLINMGYKAKKAGG
ncbi:MAG: translation initiation factor [Bacteroidetes bacterium]|nr:translation initiation factor [Bacteroidota bacterium]